MTEAYLKNEQEWADIFVHETAIIEPPVFIGDGSKIWHWTHIMPDVKIGKNVTIGQNCFFQTGAKVGDNCKIQNNVSIYDGVELEDNVFVGPSAVFTNVRKPKANDPVATSAYARTVVRKGASIGANATIVCGVEIGEGATIGAGSVVSKNVPPHVTVVGNPAGILVRDNQGTPFVMSFTQYYIKKRTN